LSTAIALGVLRLAWRRGRPIPGRENVAFLASSGICASLWMLWVFVVGSPDEDAIRLTSDPILLRAWSAILAGVAVPLVGTLFYRWWIASRTRWPVRVARSVLALGVLGLVALSLPTDRSNDRRSLPDIFLFSIDTLRADHLGCYGYPLPTSPRIDRLCEESIVFENAMAPAPATIPSYTSIMTGLMQDRHGVYSNYHKADPTLVTIAERLGEAGYVTGAIIDGAFPGTFANVGQGFDEIVQRGVTARSAVSSVAEGLRTLVNALLGTLAERYRWEISPTTYAARRWLSEIPEGRPAFAHFYWPFPHDPYLPPPRFLREVPPPDVDPELVDMVHRYDAEILFADVQIGRVLDALRDQRRDTRAWILFTADHGEELGRWVEDESGGRARYTGHSRYLFDSSLRVPLVIRPPAEEAVDPRRESSVVSTAAIAATLLEAAGVGRSPEMLEALPLEPSRTSEDRAFSVARSPIKPVDLVSIRRGRWRLVEQREPTPVVELYDYGSGSESANVAANHADLVDELLDELHAWDPPAAGADGGAEGDGLGLSDRERERLEALGYLF
jgi:arylsulfatase A-like enzyme